MLRGMMMSGPMMLSNIIEYAAEVHPKGEIVSATLEGGLHRESYAEAARRIRKLANALIRLGVKPGDRVATMAWNGYRHFELYYAISGIGAVCHTINPRLFPQQLAFIVTHAEDTHLFFDLNLADLVARMRPSWPAGLRYVVMTDAAHRPETPGLEDMLVYEDLIAGESELFDWPEFDETTASALCYTSGTTGNPKGALYSHRSTMLLAFLLSSTARDIDRGTRLLPVVPLFHVNAWGLPYSAPLTGTDLIMPGPRLDGATLFNLMETTGTQVSWGVPTVWTGLLAEMEARGAKPRALESVLIGGSAPSQTMIEDFEYRWDVRVTQGWGMTETSPVGAIGWLSPHERLMPRNEQIALKTHAGKRCFGISLKIVDDEGRRLPHDDMATGHLHVRGGTVISGYFNDPEATAKAFDADGWFSTGDIARISPAGLLTIVDRQKDLVKSGGEWISSLEVENYALEMDAVAQCALIGLPHPKWTERPVLFVVARKDTQINQKEILDFLGQKLAKWQVPDRIIEIDALPMTATGKVWKMALRKEWAAADLFETELTDSA